MPAAGLSTVSAHRRSLVTAAAAGAVLCALWFVPSANAAPDGAGAAARNAVTAHAHGAQQVPQGTSSGAVRAGGHPGADDGLGTTYAAGGLGLAGATGALIIRSRRRAAAGRSQTSSPVAD